MKNEQKYATFGISMHMISLSTFAMRFKHQKTLEVTGGQKEINFEKYNKGPNFWNRYSYTMPILPQM